MTQIPASPYKINPQGIKLDALAQQFAAGFPPLNAWEQQLARTIYQLLITASSVSLVQLAMALDCDVAKIRDTFGQWPNIHYDHAGHITGFWGLTLSETPHQLTVNGHTIYTWCAWDTLFLPELLTQPVHVISPCAATGELVQLTVSPHSVESAKPESAVVSFLKPTTQGVHENVVTHFCRFVHFFRSHADGERWIREHPGIFLLTLEQAFIVGKKVNALLYGRQPSIEARPIGITLESTLTCPACGVAKIETMPTDACQFFYECTHCKTLLRPKAGDCCVFCSYGSVPCPPIQQQRGCC